MILARDLGRTEEELGLTMDYHEYMRWMALYDVEGEERQRAMKRAQDPKGHR